MGDLVEAFNDNTEYAFNRTPDLQVITSGAKVRYTCYWKGPGNPPTAMVADGTGGGKETLRDGIRWYRVTANPAWYEHKWVHRAFGKSHEETWSGPPGQYAMLAEIINGSTGAQTYRSKPQQIGDAGALLSNWLDKLLKEGDGPSPDEAKRDIGRYLALLKEIATRLPGNDAAKHKTTVERWTELASRLAGLLAPSDGKRRIAVRGMHLEFETQVQRPLLLFLTELGPGQWSLVDWTDPSHPRFRGQYDGDGDDAQEAIEDCFSEWDWYNKYPEGQVTFDLPVELRAVVGGAARRQMETNGTSLGQEVVIIFQWIAIGAMAIAGFCFIFVGIPTLTAVAMGTSMLASTAASTMSIAQRWRDGLFDWKADAIDGLTIVSNLAGTGAWLRGANVTLLAKGGATVDYVFFGVRVGSDAASGILIIASKANELDDLTKNTTFTPDERARRMLMLFSELATVGLMAAVSFKASAREADALRAKPQHLSGDPRVNVPDETLAKLTKSGEKVKFTDPPIGEGHTKNGKQKTTVETGVAPASVARLLRPDETDFARAYPRDRHPWKKYKMEEGEIHLIDKDGFEFHATCDAGVLDITIVAVHDPKLATPAFLEAFGPNFKKSEVLRAKELYPKMYKHFKQVGNPVTRLQGYWAWTNYLDAKAEFDKLIARGMSEDAAAKIAVLHARSFKEYHARPDIGGFTNPVVVAAKHLPENRPSALFSFTIDNAD